MEAWLLDNINRLLIGLFGMGMASLAGVLLRKSWQQSVRLYQDDLVRCQSREAGHLETIALQRERSTIREGLTADLLAEVDRLKEKAEYWEREATTSRPTKSRRQSSAKRSSSAPS